VGGTLRRLGGRVTTVVTDGWAGYAALVAELPGGRHLLCLFQQQQGVTRWCQEHLGTGEEVEPTKQAMKRVVQTTDTRTVRRRLAALAAQADALGMGGWVPQTLETLSCLLPAIGRCVLPSTTHAIERFFRTVNRFSTGRCGCHALRSATWDVVLFLLGSRFTQRDSDGMAPIEAIVPEARQMPLSRLITDPLAVVLGVDHVTLLQPIAHEAYHAALAASY
jgi:hypothetical protein